MIPNNNFSVLPWYTNIQEQNARKWWAYGRVYPLCAPLGKILPFQIIVPHVGSPSVASFKLINANTNAIVGDYTSALTSGGLVVKQFASQGVDVVVFSNGDATIFPSVSVGRYYFSIQINEATYYSDIFTWTDYVYDFLKIEWWDDRDFYMDEGIIVYAEPSFKNVLYLDSDIAKPEYLFEEEGETRDGYYFPFKMISEKRYRFQFLASEYLLDAMRFIRIADHIKITKSGQEYVVDTFLLTPEWEGDGDIASVEAEFDTSTVAKKIPYIGTPYVPPTPSSYLSVSPSNLIFAAAGESLTLNVSSNVAWSLNVPSWVTASALSGSGNATITLTAGANAGPDARSGSAVFSGSGFTSVNVSLVQQAPSVQPSLSVSPSSLGFAAAGGTENIVVTSNVAWSISVPSWITYQIISGSTNGNATVALTAAQNTGSTRTGYVQFSGSGVQTVSVEAVQTAPAASYLTASPSSIDFNANGETVEITILANVAWSLSLPNWITANVSSGSGNAQVQLTASQNTSGSSRSGNVVVSGTGVSNVNIAVAQAATFVPAISVSPTTMSINHESGSYFFQITCNGAWECSGSSDSWLTSSSSGNGNGTAEVVIGANTGSSPRTGTITFRMVDYPNETCVVTFTQAGYSPVITYALIITNASNAFSAAGGTYTPAFYGVTYEDGVETNRVTLGANDLTFVQSGSNAITRSGLTFSASNLGSTPTNQATASWNVTWNAHSVSASFTATQEANTSAIVSDNSYNDYSQSDPLWDDSGTTLAMTEGDSATLNNTINIVHDIEYVWTSGVHSYDTSTQTVQGVFSVSGNGLSVVGSTLLWDENREMRIREGELTLSYNNVVLTSWTLAQAPRSISTIRVDHPYDVWDYTTIFSNPSVSGNVVTWRNANFPNKYTSIAPEVYDDNNPDPTGLVYDDDTLTTPFGAISYIS